MLKFLRVLILAISALLLVCPAFAQAASREELKGLDEQVQEIKGDILAIAAELARLEEKLLYPSDTQVAVFVSLAAGEKFRLDALEVQLDGQPVARHLYTFKELEALQKGGVQRIHTGNTTGGEHHLKVILIGKSDGGGDLRREQEHRFTKGVGPKIVEVVLAGQAVTFRDR